MTRRLGVDTPAKEPPPFLTPPAGSTLRGNLPLPAKPTVAPKSLTPHEQKLLLAAGHKPGQPIPADLADNPVVQAMMREIEAEDNAPMALPEGFTGVKIPDPVEVPPERMAEFTQILRDAAAEQTAAAQARAATGVSQDAAPGVAEALMAAQTVDDRNSATYATSEPKHAPLPPPVPQFCPHCEWPIGREDNQDPTPAERHQFMDCYLTGVAFTKTYPLMEGHLKLTVRQLIGDEEEQCYQQALRDFQNNEIQIMDVPNRTMRYRTCLQLIKFEPKGQETIELPETYKAWQATGQKGTVNLQKVRETVYDQVLRSESLLRTADFVVSEFVRLTLKLEAQVFNPDFLKRTA